MTEVTSYYWKVRVTTDGPGIFHYLNWDSPVTLDEALERCRDLFVDPVVSIEGMAELPSTHRGPGYHVHPSPPLQPGVLKWLAEGAAS